MSNCAITAAHVDKSTLTISINVPEHAQRTASATFERTRPLLIKREGDRCFICGRTSVEVGIGHEAHHCYLEWCLADAIDWAIVQDICKLGEWGFTDAQRQVAKAFDWTGFDPADPAQIERFTDDMTIQGVLLCKEHHTGSGTGIHMMDHPRWIGQKIVKPGYVLINNDVMGTEAEVLQEVMAEEGMGSS